MAHVLQGTRGRPPVVPEAWLAATARLTDYAIRISGQHRIAIKIGPGLAKESGTAQFSPFHKTIEIDSNVLAPGMRPDDVMPNDEVFRASNPMVMGALFHELGHSKHSRWVPKDLNEGEAKGRFQGRKSEVLVVLEESRCERKMANSYATALDYFPSVVLDLLVKEFKGNGDPYSMSIATGLMLLRAHVGIMRERDVADVRNVIEEVLTEEQIETLLYLGEQYHALPFPKYEPLPLDDMERIATEWLAVVGIDAEAETDSQEVLVMESHTHGDEGSESGEDGSDGSGEGESTGEGSEGSEGDSEASAGDRVRDAAAKAKHERDMGSAEKVRRAKNRKAAAERKSADERKDEGEKRAKKAFEADMPGIGYSGEAGSNSRLKAREPSGDERTAAAAFRRKLGKVMVVDEARARTATKDPGKRLRGRALMQKQADEARGKISTEKIWSQRKRVHTEDLPLSVGVALDISGSMRSYGKVNGVLNYIVGRGVTQAGGNFASVAFGTRATGLVKNGQKVSHVTDVRPHDGWENIKDAMLTLDHELNLVDGEGVRILFYLSDGAMVRDEQRIYASEQFPIWSKKGVVIIHVDLEHGAVEALNSSHLETRHNNPLPPLVIDPDLAPAEVANILGDEVVKYVKAAWAARGVAA